MKLYTKPVLMPIADFINKYLVLVSRMHALQQKSHLPSITEHCHAFLDPYPDTQVSARR